MTNLMTSKTRRVPAVLIVSVALHFVSAPAGADMMYNQEQVPLERLVARLEERLAEKPADPHLHYTFWEDGYQALSMLNDGTILPTWDWVAEPDADEKR